MRAAREVGVMSDARLHDTIGACYSVIRHTEPRIAQEDIPPTRAPNCRTVCRGGQAHRMVLPVS
jgi:hypothetical protein